MTKTLLTFAAAALLAGCNLIDSDYNADRTPKMNKPMPKIEKLFAQTKPVCFGRFIIDVPATAQVVWGPTMVNDDIVSYPGQAIKIPAEIRDKVEEIKAIRHLKEPSTLIGVFDGPNSDSKIVVGYKSRHDSGLIQLHSYIRLGKHAFVQSAPTAVLDDLPGGGDDKTSYKKYVAEMQDIARHLRVREENEIPAEPGICLEVGFIAEADGRYHEMTSIGFRFPEYADVTFSIQTQKTARVDESNSLGWSLRKGQEFAGVAGLANLYSRIKSLREGQRRIDDWEGDEKLGRLPAQKDGQPSVHEFLFQSVGVAHDMLRPIIDMDMHTGVQENTKGVFEPSLKDDEAIAFWDRLTSSIRTRSAAAPSPAPSASASKPPADDSNIVPGSPRRPGGTF